MSSDPGFEMGGQLSLPLDVIPEPDPVLRDDPETWPGWRVLERAEPAVHLARATASAAVALVMRWALRIGLPIAGMAAMLQLLPYRTTVGGVPFRVSGSVLGRPGLSADTTLGSWEFPSVSGLPFGVHISPENVNLLAVVAAAKPNAQAYAQQLRDGLQDRAPAAALWLAGVALLGLALGLAAAAAINLAVRSARGLAARADELAHRGRQLLAVAVVAGAVACYGLLSYNPQWVRESRLTGTLAAAQLFPDQLSQYYDQQSKALDVLGSILGIQAALQEQIERGDEPAAALRIMYVSDLHLAAAYPLIAQYARNYDVDLIINTGDESEFGVAAELTPQYLAGMTQLTAIAPMIWIAGNHDSPAVEQVMRAAPGVIVLGSKELSARGVTVRAGALSAYGLVIGGVPDPRIYGGPGKYGSDDPSVTDPLERDAVAEATGNVASAARFDIFAAHEPVAAAQLRKSLPGQIRQTVAGHTHAQNPSSEIQSKNGIDLVEGSTGAGGLDNIVRGEDAPPVAFSIQSVAQDCQFTRIIRFQLRLPDPADGAPTAYGDNVTASTVFFQPQDVAPGRVCGTGQPVGSPALI